MNNTNNRIPNRKQRRNVMKYQGILGVIGKLSLEKRSEIRESNRIKGKEIHATNVDAYDQYRSEQFEIIEGKKIIAWKAMGYNDKEIEMLREANAILIVKDKKMWHADKKEARLLMKKARESLNKRLND